MVRSPGRIIDHLAERNIVLSGTELLVLDEADQMLDLGFLGACGEFTRSSRSSAGSPCPCNGGRLLRCKPTHRRRRRPTRG
jgi:hypothetical protein